MRVTARRGVVVGGLALVLLAAALVGRRALVCPGARGGGPWPEEDEEDEEEEELVVRDERGRGEYRYSKETPLVFVGGVPRSGTTLMRAMLDAHPEVRCGQETRIIPRLLAMRQAWARSAREKARLDEAGVTERVLDAAVRAFVLEVIARHGEPARFLCNKDPFTLKSSVYLARLFPNSKFLLMVRDGRASVHSMISRKVTIAGFDLTSYRDCLTKWNRAIEVMYAQCLQVGRAKCLPVYYEQLVLHPQRSLRHVVDFLGLAWTDALLHHEDLIGKPGGVSLSKIERSTDQVIKPVNLEALSKWIGHIPEDVVQDMAHIAPMLAKLGYDPYANPPNYGDPDPFVVNNTNRMDQNTILSSLMKGAISPVSRGRGRLPVLIDGPPVGCGRVVVAEGLNRAPPIRAAPGQAVGSGRSGGVGGHVPCPPGSPGGARQRAGPLRSSGHSVAPRARRKRRPGRRARIRGGRPAPLRAGARARNTMDRER
uniref:Protein-tyrosine sulfotransferase n=1 Tax=Ornithorhynchus anatinus TaxID=9258 RepID=F6XMW5_ORNAN